MSVPRRRLSKARTAQRKGGKANRVISIQDCEKCSRGKLPHRACSFCGHYRNEVFVK